MGKPRQFAERPTNWTQSTCSAGGGVEVELQDTVRVKAELRYGVRGASCYVPFCTTTVWAVIPTCDASRRGCIGKE